MDSDRFDELSKKLARPRSRREALGLLGAAVASLVTGKSVGAAPKEDKPSKCYGGGSSCTNAKQCCSGTCTNRRCAPEIPPECTAAADCPGADTECQVRTCTAGVCGTENRLAGTDCLAGVCNGTGQCVECLSGADCESGLCENGACTPTCLDDPQLGQPCSAGLGVCRGEGFYVCTEDRLGVVCDAVQGAPNPNGEICNGLDDDCDGIVDDGAICPPAPNGTSACVGGNCVVQSCNPGFANCNGNPDDGCETNIATNPNNCGFCGRVCSAGPNSSPICTQGNCGLACSPGFKNCNLNLNDGCECPPTGECRSNACCISDGAPAHPTIPCCNFQFVGTCFG
jgi:hypothetical protein